MKSANHSSSGREAVKSRLHADRGCAAPPGRAGGPPRLAAPLGALYAVLAHQALHPAAADLLAGAQQRLPHPPRSVGEVVALRVARAITLEQPLIVDRPGPSAAPVARW